MMTVQEIDAKIEKIRSEMGKYNFCITFELMDILHLQELKAKILAEDPQQPPQQKQPSADEPSV